MADLRPIYRGSESANLFRLKARGSYLSAIGADTDRIDREIDAIEARGMKRAEEQAAEDERARAQAARDLAAAKAEKRNLPAKKRAAAIRARNDAKVQQAAEKAAAKVRNKSSWW